MILSLGLAITAATSADVPASSPFAGMPNVKFQYYDVEGRSPAEIYRSMRARAPQKGDGVAHTAWHIRVGWRQARRGDDCEVADPITSLSITVTLPRLVSTVGVTPQATEFWERTMRGLEIHEAGHARIAIDHRHDFVKAAARATCGSIKDVAKRTQGRIEEIQEEYDRRTRHGIAQIPAAGE
jgi:predicted secreted Zn-dependent protease